MRVFFFYIYFLLDKISSAIVTRRPPSETDFKRIGVGLAGDINRLGEMIDKSGKEKNKIRSRI